MRKALKAIFFTCAAVLVVMFFLSLLGIIDNNRGNSFGFFYRTDYVSFLLTMAMVYIAITDGWVTWLGELGLILLDAYMLWLRGKTGFACLFILTFIILWRHYRRNGGVPFQDKKSYGLISYLFLVIYLPVRAVDWCTTKLKLISLKPVFKRLLMFSFPICFALNLILIYTYQPLKSFWESVPVLGTFKDRLIYGLLGLQEYPIRLFGNDIAQTVLDRSDLHKSLYFVLDSGYMKMLIDYGLIPFLILFGGLTGLLILFYRKNYGIGMMILGVLAVDCIVEYQITNWVLVLVFLVVSYVFPGEGGMKNCDKIIFRNLKPTTRWALGVITAVLLIMMSIWCVTAYRVSTRQIWEPEYNATLVVPGKFLDQDADVLNRAGEYLVAHDDSVCVVSCGDDRDSLILSGIDPARIYICEYESIDEMLTNSHSLITEEELPSRMTICAYNMQLERISRHAEVLHIPINSVTVKPDSNYLILFAGEQWRLLCGK